MVVTPTAFILKVFRKDVLNLKNNNKKTYWIIKSEVSSSLKNQY